MQSHRRANDELGRRLRLLREQREIGTRELAERTGFSQSKVSQIERGVVRPTEADVTRVCIALKADTGRTASLLNLARGRHKPESPLTRRSKKSSAHIQQTETFDMIDAARSIAVASFGWMPPFAQTPEYILKIWQTNPMITATSQEFVRDRMMLAARSFVDGPDRTFMLGLDVLRNPLLPFHLWAEQISLLSQRLRHVHEDFGIVVDNISRPFQCNSIIDDTLAITETEDDWKFHSNVKPAVDETTQLMKSAVWEGDATKLVAEELRRFEITVDLREPQKYF